VGQRRRGLSEFYAELLTIAFGVPFLAGRPPEVPPSEQGDTAADDTAGDLEARLISGAAVDAALVVLLENQTQSLRLLDRELGAASLLTQTEGILLAGGAGSVGEV